VFFAQENSTMIILNCTHLLTSEHLARIETLTRQQTARMIDAPTQFDQVQDFVPQIETLADGVRLNIRPFVTAGVLRSRFTINWNKDRGTNPDGSERINDLHETRAEKLAARDRVAGE
jgi:hypothetical protein